MSYEHLKEAAADALQLTPEGRCEFVREDRWIGYSAATAVLNEVSDLVRHPKNLRMPCRAVVGDPDNGKTMLLRQCVQRNREVVSDNEESHLPILYFETPPEPDEGRLYSQILTALRIAHREDAAPEKLLGKVIDRCASLNVRVLVADEFHNMLNGTPARQRQFLASLKSLINILRVSFVAGGIGEIVRALATDGQFVTRFEKLSLPKWGINEESRKLLKSLEMILPLEKPSNLSERELAPTILSSGGGAIGGITRVVKEAAILAIRGGRQCIELDVLNDAIKEIRARTLTG